MYANSLFPRKSTVSTISQDVRPLHLSSPPDAIYVSEWLAHKVIKGYLMTFSESTWPDVVKWTFILGIVSLHKSGIPVHLMAVEDLIDVVKDNGGSSITPAQRLCPLQWAGKPAIPHKSNFSKKRGTLGDNSGPRTQHAGKRAPRWPILLTKPSNTWRRGDVTTFRHEDPSEFERSRTRRCTSEPRGVDVEEYQFKETIYPHWWGDWTPSDGTYSKATLGPLRGPMPLWHSCQHGSAEGENMLPDTTELAPSYPRRGMKSDSAASRSPLIEADLPSRNSIARHPSRRGEFPMASERRRRQLEHSRRLQQISSKAQSDRLPTSRFRFSEGLPGEKIFGEQRSRHTRATVNRSDTRGEGAPTALRLPSFGDMENSGNTNPIHLHPDASLDTPKRDATRSSARLAALRGQPGSSNRFSSVWKPATATSLTALGDEPMARFKAAHPGSTREGTAAPRRGQGLQLAYSHWLKKNQVGNRQAPVSGDPLASSPRSEAGSPSPEARTEQYPAASLHDMTRSLFHQPDQRGARETLARDSSTHTFAPDASALSPNEDMQSPVANGTAGYASNECFNYEDGPVYSLDDANSPQFRERVQSPHFGNASEFSCELNPPVPSQHDGDRRQWSSHAPIALATSSQDVVTAARLGGRGGVAQGIAEREASPLFPTSSTPKTDSESPAVDPALATACGLFPLPNSPMSILGAINNYDRFYKLGRPGGLPRDMSLRSRERSQMPEFTSNGETVKEVGTSGSSRSKSHEPPVLSPASSDQDLRLQRKQPESLRSAVESEAVSSSTSSSASVRASLGVTENHLKGEIEGDASSRSSLSSHPSDPGEDSEEMERCQRRLNEGSSSLNSQVSTTAQMTGGFGSSTTPRTADSEDWSSFQQRGDIKLPVVPAADLTVQRPGRSARHYSGSSVSEQYSTFGAPDFSSMQESERRRELQNTRRQGLSPGA